MNSDHSTNQGPPIKVPPRQDLCVVLVPSIFAMMRISTFFSSSVQYCMGEYEDRVLSATFEMNPPVRARVHLQIPLCSCVSNSSKMPHSSHSDLSNKNKSTSRSLLPFLFQISNRAQPPTTITATPQKSTRNTLQNTVFFYYNAGIIHPCNGCRLCPGSTSCHNWRNVGQPGRHLEQNDLSSRRRRSTAVLSSIGTPRHVQEKAPVSILLLSQ